MYPFGMQAVTPRLTWRSSAAICRLDNIVPSSMTRVMYEMLTRWMPRPDHHSAVAEGGNSVARINLCQPFGYCRIKNSGTADICCGKQSWQSGCTKFIFRIDRYHFNISRLRLGHRECTHEVVSVLHSELGSRI